MNQRLTDLARQYRELRAKKEFQADVLKAISADLSTSESELLEAMVEEGVNSLRIDGVGLLSMKVTNYLSVNVANKPAFFEYLQESGNGGLLKLDVNPKTLTAFLSEHLKALTKDYVDSGMDEIDARNKALDGLKSKGASYFSERGISLRQA